MFFAADDFWGDPRHCPRHPVVRTSSADGLHDAPCGLCEAEMEQEPPTDMDTLREVVAWADAQPEAFWFPKKRRRPTADEIIKLFILTGGNSIRNILMDENDFRREQVRSLLGIKAAE